MGNYLEVGYEKAVTHKVTGITGPATVLAVALERPFNNWMLQVYGVGGIPTAWDVTLKGGLDADKVGTMINHASGSEDDGDLKTVEGLPAQYVEVEVNSLTEAPADSITVVVIGMEL